MGCMFVSIAWDCLPFIHGRNVSTKERKIEKEKENEKHLKEPPPAK